MADMLHSLKKLEDDELLDQITFDATQQGPDELVRVVNGDASTWGKSPASANKFDVNEAIKRVNTSDSGVKGVTAYKDNNGRAVLTNAAILNGGAGPETPSAKFGGAANTPLPLFETLAKLRGEQDLPAAQAMYDSLQQTVVSERTRLEKEAQQFAESKVGTSSLQVNLMQAELADRADPLWTPGIGDSPITASIRAQLNTSRSLANAEAKNFLASNMSYNSLIRVEKDANAEYNRVRTTSDRKELMGFQNEERNANKKFAADQKMEEAAEGISASQLKRIQQLNEGDFDPTSDTPAKVTALKLVMRNKDKSYREAIDADETALPKLALKGNSYAAKLVVKEEANRTGQTEDEVAGTLIGLRKEMQNPKFVENVFRARFPDPKKFKEEMGDFNALKKTKPGEVTDMMADMAVEYMARVKTANFSKNVATWKSLDPDLDLAVKATRKEGRELSAANVLTSFTTDKEGKELPGEVLLARLAKFKVIANESAMKQENSLFGRPGTDEVMRLVASKATTSLQQFIQRNTSASGVIATPAFSQMYNTGMKIHNSQAGRDFRGWLQGLNPEPIDPITKLPFNSGVQ